MRSAGRAQSGQGDCHQAGRCGRRGHPGRGGEGMEAISGEFIGWHVPADLAGGRAFGDQVADALPLLDDLMAAGATKLVLETTRTFRWRGSSVRSEWCRATDR